MYNVILTNYFTTKADPQKKQQQSNNDSNLIAPWKTSLTSLRLNGIIFYDDLDRMLIKRNQSNFIKFRKYSLKTSWSLNDERFLCFYEFLKINNDIDYVFITDLFDVTFNKNPFQLISDEYDLYLGGTFNSRKIKDSKFINIKMLTVYDKVYHEDMLSVSAGIIGGSRVNVLKLIERMVQDLTTYNTDRNINMGVVNKCVYDLFEPERLLIGSPVSSKVNKFEEEGDFAIRHK
jgi:hypothetical protein